jgi:hypothetical protein
MGIDSNDSIRAGTFVTILAGKFPARNKVG